MRAELCLGSGISYVGHGVTTDSLRNVTRPNNVASVVGV